MNEQETKQLAEMISETVKLQIEEAGLNKVPDQYPITVNVTEPQKNGKAVSPWNNLSEFAHDVYRASSSGPTKSLREWTSKTAGEMEEGDPSQGGFLVPEEFRQQLLNVALEASIVRPRATRIPMATNRVVLPAVIDDDHSSDFFGGITIARTGEGAAKSNTNPKLGQIALTLHKLTGLVRVSDELLEDSPISLQPILTSLFGQAIAFTEDSDFLTGDGSNKALGVFNAANPALVSVAKEAGQTADTIVFENILKMWSRLHSSSMRNAVWVANNDTFEQLATMSLTVSSGGSAVYLPSNGAAGAPFGTLMGRPLMLSEKMQTLGDAGDIGVADFSTYFIGDKGGVSTASSIHLRFDYDETVFRFVMRYDGQPSWRTTLTPLKSSSTLSPYVSLAERA